MVLSDFLRDHQHSIGKGKVVHFAATQKLILSMMIDKQINASGCYMGRYFS